MDQLVEVVTTPRPLSLYTLFSQNGRKYQSDVSLKTLIIDAFVVTISGTVACWYNPPPPACLVDPPLINTARKPSYR